MVSCRFRLSKCDQTQFRILNSVRAPALVSLRATMTNLNAFIGILAFAMMLQLACATSYGPSARYKRATPSPSNPTSAVQPQTVIKGEPREAAQSDDRSSAVPAGRPLSVIKGELREAAQADDRRSALRIYKLIDEILAQPPKTTGEPLVGTWVLLYTDDEPTRSSPFFWAFKKAFGDTPIPVSFAGKKNFADGVFAVTDSIPSTLKKIGPAMQFVSADGSLISQVEIISPIGTSLMTTTSRWSRTSPGSEVVELRVLKTQVLESSIARLLNLPSSNPLISSGFPSGAALEIASPGSSTVSMEVLFIDDTLRISRNPADDKLFLYERSSLDKPRGL